MCPLWLLLFVFFASKNFCNFENLFSKTSIAIPFHLLRVCLLFNLLCYLYLRLMFLAVIFMFHSFWWGFPLFEFWQISWHSSLKLYITKRFSNQFRSPRSMRSVADVSIQMILGESTSLITTVGFIQLFNFMYNRSDTSSASSGFCYPIFHLRLHCY